MAVHSVTDSDFASKVATGVTLVDFWAPWCKPCKAMLPTIEALSEEMSHVQFVKMNVEDNETADQFGVASVPTLLLLKNGKKIGMIAGSRTRQQMVEFIEQAL